jgi:hypothetical protein
MLDPLWRGLEEALFHQFVDFFGWQQSFDVCLAQKWHVISQNLPIYRILITLDAQLVIGWIVKAD